MGAVDVAGAAAAFGFDGALAPGLHFADQHVEAVVRPDPKETARRAAAGLGALDGHYHLVEALAGLPLGEPVPWAELDRTAQRELAGAPPGVVAATATHVERLWRPAVQVVGVLAVTGDWRLGIQRAGLLGGHAPGGVVLLRRPRRPGPVLERAGRFGLGVAVPGARGGWELLRPPTPIHPVELGPRHWRFLEAAYAAWRRAADQAPPSPAAQRLRARRDLAAQQLAGAAAALGFAGQLVEGVRLAGTSCAATVLPDDAELARRAAAGLGALHPYRHYQLFEVLAVLPHAEPVAWDDLDADAHAELAGAPPGVIDRVGGTHVVRLWRPAVRVTGVLVLADRARQGLAQVSLFAAHAPRGLAAVRRPRPATLAAAAQLGIGVAAFDDRGGWRQLLAPAARHGRTLDGSHWRFLEAVAAALLRQQATAGHGRRGQPFPPDRPHHCGGR
jgi:hypothetical protein